MSVNRYMSLGHRLEAQSTPDRKLTRDQVNHIEVILSTGVASQQTIGDAFGIQQSTVSAIKRGKHWAQQSAAS